MDFVAEGVTIMIDQVLGNISVLMPLVAADVPGRADSTPVASGSAVA
jgi:hypothetical protein